MPDNNNDFQSKVKSKNTVADNVTIRECYGFSNRATFITGGFLCGIPNLESLDKNTESLCVFSKIHLGPKSELHIAVLIKDDFQSLFTQLSKMVIESQSIFADKNNNCGLFLWSDGNIYAHNKAKVNFELTTENVNQLGPGIKPDAIYWAVYGDGDDSKDSVIEHLAKLIDSAKFTNIAVTSSSRSSSINIPPDLVWRLLTEFQSACKAANFETTLPLGNRYAASLLSKRLIMLTGLSGSGKTKLAQAFTRWLAPNADNYQLVAVGADWTGNENILGYPNGLDKTAYITKPALDLILHAAAHQETPHFLILDEMNLSHVERYFADILSAIESEEAIHLHGDTERFANGITIPAKIDLPKNLFIVGTVNVDETTYMFSPKVLDRANVIEFRMDSKELGSFLASPGKPDLSKLDGKGAGFGRAFVQAAKGSVDLPADAKDAFEKEMLLFFQAMQAHGSEFGYRVAHEAVRFVYFYKLLGNYADDENWFSSAFDCVVVQKFLPKLHGSRAKLGPLLKVLWFLCVTDTKVRGNDALKAATEAARSTDKKAEPSSEIPTDAPYPLSAEKIARMWRLLRDNGFASFAEA